MTENTINPPSDADIDKLLDPDVMSGRQIEALRKIDEKNVDHSDLKNFLLAFIEGYESAKAGGG